MQKEKLYYDQKQEDYSRQNCLAQVLSGLSCAYRSSRDKGVNEGSVARIGQSTGLQIRGLQVRVLPDPHIYYESE